MKKWNGGLGIYTVSQHTGQFLGVQKKVINGYLMDHVWNYILVFTKEGRRPRS
jgi:hypothetical protein